MRISFIVGSVVTSIANSPLLVIPDFPERICLFALLLALEHHGHHDIPQDDVLRKEDVDLVACRAFKLILVDIALSTLLRERHVAILAAHLEALRALHYFRLDHHAQRALDIFWE